MHIPGLIESDFTLPKVFLFAFPEVKPAFSVMKVISLFQIRKLGTLTKRKGHVINEYIPAVPDKEGAETVKVLGVSV